MSETLRPINDLLVVLAKFFVYHFFCPDCRVQGIPLTPPFPETRPPRTGLQGTDSEERTESFGVMWCLQRQV